MSRFKLYPTNLVTKEETEITSSSEDSQFPVSNIKHPFTTKVTRSIDGVEALILTFDLQIQQPIDTVMIVPSSMGTFGFFGNVIVRGNGTSNFASPALVETLTPNEYFNLGHLEFDEVNYRYWQLEFESTDFVEVSKIFIGKSVYLESNNIDYGWNYLNQDNSTYVSNRYGQRFIDVINNEISISAEFKYLNIEEVEAIMSAFDDAGKRSPIWAMVDSEEVIISDKERFAGYFYLNQRPDVENSSFRLYNINFTLHEAL